MPDWKAKIGDIDWTACEKCIHGNHEDGGCLIMSDAELGDIGNFKVDGDFILCKQYEEDTHESQ